MSLGHVSDRLSNDGRTRGYESKEFNLETPLV